MLIYKDKAYVNIDESTSCHDDTVGEGYGEGYSCPLIWIAEEPYVLGVRGLFFWTIHPLKFSTPLALKPHPFAHNEESLSHIKELKVR